LLPAARRSSAGKTSETRSQRVVPQGANGSFRPKRYAGGKSPAYRQPQSFKFDFVSFFSFQAIEQ
jgi:hypothetical protein